jgi:hypothetical protein
VRCRADAGSTRWAVLELGRDQASGHESLVRVAPRDTERLRARRASPSDARAIGVERVEGRFNRLDKSSCRVSSAQGV